MSLELPASFELLNIDDNANGWGPSTVPEKFSDLPYQPFNKDIKLGKIADWTSSYNPDIRKKQDKLNQLNLAGNQYAYIHEDDESTFHMVNTIKDQKSSYLKQRNKYAANRTRREKVAQRHQQQMDQQARLGLTKKQKFINRERQQSTRIMNKMHGRLNNAGGIGGQGGAGGGWNNDYRRQNQNKIHREPSVQVKDTWKVVEEIEVTRFNKLSMPSPDKDVEDLWTCGEMKYYDKNYDRVTVHSTQKLKQMNRLIHNVATGDDPIIRKLIREKAGNVFATDALIAALMSCSRSVESWDIVAQRVGDILLLDKRPDNSSFNFITVNETSGDMIPETLPTSLNSPKNLSLEATYINHNFVQQVLQNKNYSFQHPNPFIEEEDEKENLGSVGYRYRRFNLGNDIKLVVRCEHDAVVDSRGNTIDENSDAPTQNNPPQFMTIRALNEWDSHLCKGIDWRSKLDVQRGAILGAEIKNNSYKLAKWTLSALLSGSDHLRLGYVSRENSKFNNSHTILAVQQFRPSEFASQINLKMENAWAVLKSVIDLLLKLETNKMYLIMRDPNKPVIRIYSVPNDAFEEDVDVDSDEQDDDEQ